MATLPNTARRPIPIDTLLARHARPVSGPITRNRPILKVGNPLTLDELERASSIAERSEGGDAPPSLPETAAVALVLCLTRATCACGRVYTYPNRAVLVRFDRAGLSNAVHYARGTLDQYAALPRERKTLDIEIPYCDECF